MALANLACQTGAAGVLISRASILAVLISLMVSMVLTGLELEVVIKK
jgi:hypothetical protein